MTVPKGESRPSGGDAHGHILDRDGGALYVHLHREIGLAHRRYVLKPWQVRGLAILTARPLLVLYVAGFVAWGWMAGQAARVPLLRYEVAKLRADVARVDSLSVTLEQLQSRYDQVQRMLGATTAEQAAAAVRDTARQGSPSQRDVTDR